MENELRLITGGKFFDKKDAGQLFYLASRLPVQFGVYSGTDLKKAVLPMPSRWTEVSPMEDTLFYLGEWNLSPGLNVLVFLSGERYLGIASHLFGGSRHPVIFVECEKTISSAVVRAAEPFYSKYAHATVAPKLVEEEPTPPMGNDENETKKPNIFSKMLGLFDLLRLFRT